MLGGGNRTLAEKLVSSRALDVDSGFFTQVVKDRDELRKEVVALHTAFKGHIEILELASKRKHISSWFQDPAESTALRTGMVKLHLSGHFLSCLAVKGHAQLCGQPRRGGLTRLADFPPAPLVLIEASRCGVRQLAPHCCGVWMSALPTGMAQLEEGRCPAPQEVPQP